MWSRSGGLAGHLTSNEGGDDSEVVLSEGKHVVLAGTAQPTTDVTSGAPFSTVLTIIEEFTLLKTVKAVTVRQCKPLPRLIKAKRKHSW